MEESLWMRRARELMWTSGLNGAVYQLAKADSMGWYRSVNMRGVALEFDIDGE